jgi:membrane-associated phospholipid phosphatase
MLKILINNRLFFLIFLLWVIVGALLQVFYSPTGLMFWVNRHHNNFLDVFFRCVTFLGEDYVWLSLLIYFAFLNYFQKITKLKVMKLLIITWLAKIFVSVSLKNIFNLPRPMEVYQNSGREIYLVNGVELYHWQSFPSGHTMTAFAFACFVALILKQPKWGIFALFIAILVGYSRMYLFQHFPKDVFAGGIFGIAVVCGIRVYIPRRLRQALPSKGDF